MQAEPETLFVHWLGTVLRDERWRAIIRAQVQQNELPVIEAGAEPRYSKQNRNGEAGD